MSRSNIHLQLLLKWKVLRKKLKTSTERIQNLLWVVKKCQYSANASIANSTYEITCN